MVFPEEEVHVVELDGVCAVFCDQMAENCRGALRRFHALFVAVGGMDAAEAAIEGASDACVMDCGALTEVGGPEIFLDGHAMEGMPWEFVRTLHRPFGVIAGEAEDVFIRETEDRFEGTVTSDRIEEFEDGVFALSANDVVNVFRVERGVGIDRREVAAPDDLDVGMQAADLAGGLHCCDHLWAGHDGDTEKFDVVSGDELKNNLERVVVEVAVDDLILFASFEHGRNGQYRKRETAVARAGRAWGEEDDHICTRSKWRRTWSPSTRKPGELEIALSIVRSILSNFRRLRIQAST